MCSLPIDLSEILSFLKNNIQDFGANNCRLDVEKAAEYGDGFICSVRYAILTDPKSQNCLKLVLKFSTSTPEICLKVFRREVFMYTEVFPVFKQLKERESLRESFTPHPKYFGHLVHGSNEVLILENMEAEGYSVWPKNKHLTYDHTVLLLKEFAKWHAYSFALRDQEPGIFERISECKDDFHGTFCRKTRFHSYIGDALKKSVVLLDDSLDNTSSTILKNLAQNFDYLWSQIGTEDSNYTVLCHGDCWNNNFMFKYEICPSSQRKKVSEVCIIDWQCATVSSPVYDISHILYVTSGKKQMDRMAELLDFYYNTFSNFLTKLGSDPNNLYPLKKFKQHWSKYSCHGILQVPGNMKHCFSQNVGEVNLLDSELKGANEENGDFNFIMHNPDEYKERLAYLVGHYAHFKY